MSLKPFFEEEVEFFNHWFSNHPWELHTHDLGTDMREEGDHLIVEMHVPEDIDHKDISIELIGDNRLKVSGSCESMHDESDESEQECGEGCSHGENEEGEDEYEECETFEQMVLLPANVNAEKATAELKHGVLTIRLPMISSKKHEPKKINISVR